MQQDENLTLRPQSPRKASKLRTAWTLCLWEWDWSNYPVLQKISRFFTRMDIARYSYRWAERENLPTAAVLDAMFGLINEYEFHPRFAVVMWQAFYDANYNLAEANQYIRRCLSGDEIHVTINDARTYSFDLTAHRERIARQTDSNATSGKPAT